MQKIELNSAKLLGFRLEGLSKVKTGQKIGAKLGAKLGAKIGVKLA